MLSKGIPDDDIIKDFAGRRTHDSCWRAKNVFNIEKAYLVTQAFHLPRAVYLCESVGIDTKIAIATNSRKQTTYWGILREIPASWLSITETINNYEAEIKADGSERNLSQDELDKNE